MAEHVIFYGIDADGHTHPLKITSGGALVVDGDSGITDHGALSGLADNDHPQYRLESDVVPAADVTGLADVATSGDYDDLINTPAPGGGSSDGPGWAPAHLVGSWENIVTYANGEAVRFLDGDDWNVFISKVDGNIGHAPSDVDGGDFWINVIDADKPIVFEGTVEPISFGEAPSITHYTQDATGGTFKLTLDGEDTSPIPWDRVEAGILADILDEFDDIVTTVTGDAADFVVQRFGPPLVFENIDLTGGGLTLEDTTQDAVVGGFAAAPGSIYIQSSENSSVWIQGENNWQLVSGRGDVAADGNYSPSSDLKMYRSGVGQGSSELDFEATRSGAGNGDSDIQIDSSRSSTGTGAANSHLTSTRGGSGSGNALTTIKAQRESGGTGSSEVVIQASTQDDAIGDAALNLSAEVKDNAVGTAAAKFSAVHPIGGTAEFRVTVTDTARIIKDGNPAASGFNLNSWIFDLINNPTATLQLPAEVAVAPTASEFNALLGVVRTLIDGFIASGRASAAP